MKDKVEEASSLWPAAGMPLPHKRESEMIKHIVIWPMKDDVTDAQKTEMKLRLEALKNVIDELIDIEVGIDDDNDTMSLVSAFNSEADLAAYQSHPAHLDVVGFVKPLVAGRAVCDYAC
ncbi:MAG TPA: Dabb family protein [Tichowtungia sp.]|nr:Dabb family protein [Tichowtungia sp.]